MKSSVCLLREHFADIFNEEISKKYKSDSKLDFEPACIEIRRIYQELGAQIQSLNHYIYYGSSDEDYEETMKNFEKYFKEVFSK